MSSLSLLEKTEQFQLPESLWLRTRSKKHFGNRIVLQGCCSLLDKQRGWATCSLVGASVILKSFSSARAMLSSECTFSRTRNYFHSEIWTRVCPVSDLGHQTGFLIVSYTEGLYQTTFILSVYPAPKLASALCFKSVESACWNMKQILFFINASHISIGLTLMVTHYWTFAIDLQEQHINQHWAIIKHALCMKIIFLEHLFCKHKI